MHGQFGNTENGIIFYVSSSTSVANWDIGSGQKNE